MCHARPAGHAQRSTGPLHFNILASSRNKKEADAFASASFYGAGDEARTRYLHLGKVALYRMSYTREEHGLL